MTVTDGEAKFTLKPKALKEGTYNIYISTTDKALKKVASFKYGEKPPYTPGDVNNDGSIDPKRCSACIETRCCIDYTQRRSTKGS